MAVFDVSFLNPKAPRGGGSGYNALVDSLAIQKNALEVDGKLSPGDYDLLIAKAQSIYSNPGLTANQRSNVSVTISDYKKAKAVGKLNDANDIGALNRNVQDDTRKSAMLFANDPKTYLKAQGDILQAKLSRLSDTIDSMNAAGDDPSQHLNEFNDTLAQYNDVLQAESDVGGYVAGTAPKTDYAAYVTTNSKGEVVSFDVGKVGSKNGYLETNGVYGGLPLYGKMNRKENGKILFTLGNTNFSAADVVTPDPANPGAVRAPRLFSEDTQKTQGNSSFSTAQAGTYKQVDLAGVRPQGAVPVGGWAEGGDGVFYQRKPDGGYKKFVNTDLEKLGLKENDVIRIPKSFESGIVPFVNETSDASAAPAPVPPTPAAPAPVGTGPGLGTPAPTVQSVVDQQFKLPGGRAKTPNPTERAPASTVGIAGKAIGAAKGFLSSIFGSGGGAA